MGSSDVCARLRTQLASLSSLKTPPPVADPAWDDFWTLPTSADDIICVFQPADIRYIRDTNQDIFVQLVNAVATRIIYLQKIKSVRLIDFPQHEVLNCIRVLTIIIPFLYEKKQLNGAEENLFWNTIYATPIYENDTIFVNSGSNFPTAGINSNDDLIDLVSSPEADSSNDTSLRVHYNKMSYLDRPLGVLLIDCLVDLMFTLNFTVTTPDARHSSKVFANDYQPIIWEPGFEVQGRYKEPVLTLDSNRLEVIRLLVSLFSKDLYLSVTEVVSTGSRFLTVFVTTVEGRKYYNVCVSLFNFIIRSVQSNADLTSDNGIINSHVDISNPNINGLDIQNDVHRKIRVLLATNIIQLFAILVVHPLPSKDMKFLYKNNTLPNNNEKLRNRSRLFLSKFTDTKDLRLFVESLSSLLFKPMKDINIGAIFNIMKSSKLVDDSTVHPWSKELLVIILELYQCNSRFRAVFAEMMGPEYFILIFYHLLKMKGDKKNTTFTQLCIHSVLYLSSDLRLTSKLLTHFDPEFYDSVPQILRTSTTPTSYRDFLLIHLCTLLESDSYHENKLPLLQLAYNLITMHVFLHEFNKRENREVLGKRKIALKDLSKCPPTQLSYAASMSLIHIISKFSTLTHLSADLPTNSDHLSLLLRACTHAISRDTTDSVVLLYVVFKNASLFSRLTDTLRRISQDTMTGILNQEKRQYEQDRNSQMYMHQHEQGSRHSMASHTTEQYAYDPSEHRRTIDSRDAPEMPGLSRQTTLDSIASVRSTPSMPILTRQTSQISISHDLPKLPPASSPSVKNGSNLNANLYDFGDESIDPRSNDVPAPSSVDRQLSPQPEGITSMRGYESFVILDDTVFGAVPPLGMSETSMSKQAYYGRYEDKWSGKDAMHFLKDIIKSVNALLMEQLNGSAGGKNQMSDALLAIQKLLKMDLESTIEDIDKPALYDAQKTPFSPLKFKWTAASLGWYISIVWADIFLNYNSHTGKGLLAEISSGLSAIKRASTSWGFGGWKLGSNNNNNSITNNSEPSLSSPLSSSFHERDFGEDDREMDQYAENVFKNSIWFGTHIRLFKVNSILVKEHYILQDGKSELISLNMSGVNGNAPSFPEVFWKRNSMTSPILNMRNGNGSGVFTEGFWKRQAGGRPGSLERRDSDISLKAQLSRNGTASRPSG